MSTSTFIAPAIHADFGRASPELLGGFVAKREVAIGIGRIDGDGESIDELPVATFARAQRGFGKMAIEGDGRRVGGEIDELDVDFPRQCGLLKIDGKGAEHAAIATQDRRGPARAEFVGKGEIPVFRPQWVGGDVFDKHDLAAEGCGAAVACVRADREAVGRRAVSGRDARAGGVSQVKTVRIEELDRAEHFAALLFDESQEGIQRRFERRTGRDHSQHRPMLFCHRLGLLPRGDVGKRGNDRHDCACGLVDDGPRICGNPDERAIRAMNAHHHADLRLARPQCHHQGMLVSGEGGTIFTDGVPPRIERCASFELLRR